MLLARTFRCLIATLALAAVGSPAVAQDATPFLTKDSDFKPLFDGKTLSGWTQVNCAPETFTVKDGEIVCTGVPNGVLRSDKPYANFILELEWRHIKPKSNAGLFIWSDALPIRGSCFTRSVEVQIMDGMSGDGFTSDGDVFPIQGAHMMPQTGKFKGQQDRYALPEGKFMNPSPQWNHYRVTCQDGAVTLAVNGHEVTKGDHASPASGYLCLESEGSEIHFRNIKIKQLPSEVNSAGPDPVNGPSGIGQGEGFVPLYNGLNFQGWKFGKDQEGHFKADNWTITYDGGGEDLWTEKSYKDFVLICDWRWTVEPKEVERPIILPDGKYKLGPDGKQLTQKVMDAGDSGIYLRGSSKSQVNMWCWPIGSGEVYGYRTDPKMPADVIAGVTPKVNADAPIKQWNRFVITMKGEELTVVLNGKTVIEKAKLPGVAAEGPIALQHHGDACQFANIYIKELPSSSSRALGTSLESLAKAYQGSTTDVQKRDICLKAIDEGFIRTGADKRIVSTLCGADFRPDVGSDYGIVNFEPPLPGGHNKEGQITAGGLVGWYMVVKYTGSSISDYYLSNRHK